MTSEQPLEERWNASPEGGEADIPSYLEAGRKAYSENRLLDAIPQMKRKLCLEPGNTDALVLLGAANARTGGIGSAHRLLNRVNIVDPRESRHWPIHASVAIRGRQLNTAYRLCQRVLIRAPNSVSALKDLARIANLWSHTGQAGRLLHILRALSPEDPSIAIGLARAAMMSGALEDAEIHCRRALDLSQGNAERLLDLGRVLRARGKLAEADGYLNQAVEQDPTLALARDVVRQTAVDDDFRATED